MADISSITQGADWQAELEAAANAAEIEKARQMQEKIDIQAQYIAAYTDRQPADITPEELANYQSFWNSHAEAMADVIKAKLADDVRAVIKGWIDSANITTFHFNGADLKAAYLQYGAEGQALIKAALAEPNNVYTRQYVRAAVYPTMEDSFLAVLSKEQKQNIAASIFTNTEPVTDIPTFQLFFMLYEMADDGRRALMAQAIELEQIHIYRYRQTHTAPDNIEFIQAEKQIQAQTEQKKPEPTTEPAAQLVIVENLKTDGRRQADGLEIGLTTLEQRLCTIPLNVKTPLPMKIRGAVIDADVTVIRPKDIENNAIPITQTELGILGAIGSLLALNVTEATEEMIYRQWRQEWKADVTPAQKNEVSNFIKLATQTFIDTDIKERKKLAKFLRGDLPTYRALLNAEQVERKTTGGEIVKVWCFAKQPRYYLREFSIAMGQRQLITDREIIDISETIEAKTRGLQAAAEGTKTAARHSSSEIELALRDLVLARLIAIDAEKQRTRGGAVIVKACTGNINLLQLLEKGGYGELQKTGRGNESAYKQRNKLAVWLEKYLEQLKEAGRIKAYGKTGKGDFTVTTIPQPRQTPQK